MMVYCIVNGLSYSSSFNVFAVFAGYFVMQGNVRAIRWVTFFAAFLSATFVTLLIVLPIVVPMSDISDAFERSPIGLALSSLFSLAAVILTIWTYQQLRRPPVVDVLVKEGNAGTAPTFAFLAGFLLAAGLSAAVLAEGDAAFR
jgi:hypothetical protein